jgi:hypothetical protein
VDPLHVLELVGDSDSLAYDGEFVALATRLGAKLVTMDTKRWAHSETCGRVELRSAFSSAAFILPSAAIVNAPEYVARKDRLIWFTSLQASASLSWTRSRFIALLHASGVPCDAGYAA